MQNQVNITLITGRQDAWRSAKWWDDSTVRATIFAKFWAKVNRQNGAECWPFIGHIGPHGYGVFYATEGLEKVRERAHRFAWLASRGDIPAGKEVCHRCDNTACVNPDHLFLGSHQDNHLDSVRKGRKRAWGLQKLNAEQVLEIRARSAAGESRKDVASAFGIARHHVSSIVHRTSWAHLQPDNAKSA